MDRGVAGASLNAGADASVFGMAAHTVFESVVERFPSRTAAVCGHERITYRALNAWANSIASELCKAGIRPEEPVALAVPKSIAHVAAVLGVLKAGGAYVPVVANQPPDRLRVIVQDAQCRFAVASSGYLAKVLESTTTQIDPHSAVGRHTDNLGLCITPTNLAYIMFTSGSTGRPKGAMIEHAGIVRLVHGQDYMPFGPNLNFLYGGPLSFDLSTIEIFSPLLHGGKLLISTDDVLTPDVVRHFAQGEQLNAICVSFSLFRALFQADPGAFDSIPVIGVCGEPADPGFIRRAQARLPQAQFYNAYGPTECTALTTTYQIPNPCPLDPAIVPIGVPLKQMTLRVAAADGSTVENAMAGELWIGGVGLARGYLNDSELTASRFITDPVTGGRVYRSGDLVRWLPDGSLAYLGRIDDQVKIRGQRIELGEIDAVLMADPEVAAAASVVLGSGEGASIGACIVPITPENLDVQAMKQRLRQRLTAAMMPSVLVPVTAIPFNRNGKVDRESVRHAIEAGMAAGGCGVSASVTHAPGTPSESALLAICSRLLGRQMTSTADSFMFGGGSSLLAMALRMRIRDELKSDVALTEIMAAPDIRSLAAVVDRSGNSTVDEFTPFQPGPVPMTPSQRRLWTLHQLDPSNAAYNIAFRFSTDTPPDRSALQAAWESLHTRHPSLRTAFPEATQDEPRAELRDVVTAAIEWRTRPPADADEERAELRRPFDLARPPLCRLILWPDGRGAAGLLVMHHIISDAWSMQVMFRDLEAMYRHFRDGAELRLPDPGPGQAAHAAWQERRASSSYGARARTAVNLFDGCQPTAGLIEPSDRDRPVALCTAVDLERDVLEQIEQFAARLGLSIHSVLLTAFACFAAPCCGTDEPIVGLAVSNRDDGPFADCVGFFVESVPVRIPTGAASFAELARQVHEIANEGRARRDVDFDLFTRRGKDVAGQSAITSVFFNVIDPAPIEPGAYGEQIFESVTEEVDHAIARFDLLCTIYRHGPSRPCRLVVSARDGMWLRGATPTASELADYILDAISQADRLPSQPLLANRDATMDSASQSSVNRVDAVQDHVMWVIVGVFRKVLNNERLGPDDDFFAYGGDSLRAVRAFAMIRELHPTKLTAVAMFKSTTARQLAERIRDGSDSEATATFLRLNPPGREREAILFPGVSGEIVSMRELVGAMGERWSCYAADYSASSAGGGPLTSLAQMADHFCHAIAPEVNLANADLIGYSFGGILAYEVAVRLQAQGRSPNRLVIIDAYVITREMLPPLPVRLGRRASRVLRSARERALGLAFWRSSPRPDASVPVSDDPSDPGRLLTKGRRRAIEGYRPSDKFHGQVVVIQANQPEWLGPQIVRTANGWRAWLTKPPLTLPITCTHGEVVRGVAAREIARVINQSHPTVSDCDARAGVLGSGGVDDAVLPILRSVLESPDLGPYDNFFEHGGNSLRAVRAFAAIRQRFGVDLPVATIFRFPTAEGLARAIRDSNEMRGQCRCRMIRVTEVKAGGDLIVFPGVSGETTSLQPLVQRLSSNRTVHAVDYPGVSDFQLPARSLGDLVDSVAPQGDDPFPEPDVLLGYSFGGIVAYETAVRLQQQGRPPRLLVLMDTHLLERFPAADQGRSLSAQLRMLSRLPASRITPYVGARVVRLFGRVRDRLVRREDYESQPHIRQLVAVHLSMLEGYRPKVMYEGRVLIIRGRRPDWLLASPDDGVLGWSDHLTQPPVVVDINAEHARLLSSEAAAEISRAVLDQLGER